MGTRTIEPVQATRAADPATAAAYALGGAGDGADGRDICIGQPAGTSVPVLVAVIVALAGNPG